MLTIKFCLLIFLSGVNASNAFLPTNADQHAVVFNRDNQFTHQSIINLKTSRPSYSLISAGVSITAIDVPRRSISLPKSVQTVSVGSMIGAVTAIILLIAKHGVLAINKRLFSKYPLPTLLASGALLGSLVHFFDNGKDGLASFASPTFTSLGADNLSEDKSGKLAAKRLSMRLLALVVTIGSGFSMGIAGPAAELGMVVAHRLSSTLGIKDSSSILRMLIAGAAAGVGANFNVPLTGLLFAVEVTRRMITPEKSPSLAQQPTEALAMTGSIFGALLIVNRGRLFGPSVVSSLLPGLSSSSISSLSVYHALALAALGYLTAGVHVSYDHLRRWLLHKDQPWQKRIDKRLRPVIAALFCALAAVYGYPQHLSSGFGQLAGLMRGQQGSGLGLATAFTAVRFLLVSLCSATVGLVGGQFAPMLFLGGGLGAVFYHFLVLLGLSAVTAREAGLFVLCGASAMLGLQFKAIIMAALFIAEATGQIALLIPALITAAIATVSKAVINQEQE